MKTGLVMEGGAMRGLFTAGVLDVFMENGITFDGAVGVSAGAAFGCNLKSHQIGRTLRYNKRFCRDKRYAGLCSLLRTGDIYNAKFDYEEIPTRLDPFDTETYRNDPMEFYVVATDVDTGKAVYHRCDRGDADDLQWIRASASMPGVSNIVRREGKRLLDGELSDPLPLRFFEHIGYERNVVIATRPAGFRKKKMRSLPLLRLRLGKYPALIRTLRERHLLYNETLDYICARERQGKALVIRPPEPLNIRPVTHDPDELERVYRIGRAEGEYQLENVRNFLCKTAALQVE